MATNKRGFTLIELIIVLAVIGILVVLVIAAFNPLTQLKKTRDARRKSDLRQIKTALALYYSVWGEYPEDSSGSIVGCESPPTSCTWGSVWSRDGTVFMKPLPDDSLASNPNYSYDKIGIDSFTIIATLENRSDKDIVETQIKCLGAEEDPQEYHYVVCQD